MAATPGLLVEVGQELMPKIFKFWKKKLLKSLGHLKEKKKLKSVKMRNKMFDSLCWCIKMEAAALRGDNFLRVVKVGCCTNILVAVSWSLMALNTQLKGEEEITSQEESV